MVQSRSYWEKMSGVDDEKKKKKTIYNKNWCFGGKYISTYPETAS